MAKKGVFLNSVVTLVTLVTFLIDWLECLRPLLKRQEPLFLNNWWRKTTWPTCLIGCVQKATSDVANVSRERAPSFLMALEHAASRKGLWSEHTEAERATHWEEKKRSNMETP